MTFLCDMWRISAEEYMAFLKRYDVKCLGIHIIFRDRTAIFADEERYLDLSLNDKNFIEAEKQIIKLLERSEKLLAKFTELASRNSSKQDELEESFQQYDEDE